MRGSDGHLFFDAAVAPPSHRSSDDTKAGADLDARIISSSPHDHPAPFCLLGTAAMAETKASSAVVVSCPHAGRHYPKNYHKFRSLTYFHSNSLPAILYHVGDWHRFCLLRLGAHL